VKVLEPGVLTTVQDLGRVGFQNDGVGPGGAMDRLALRAANLLVGNSEGAAGLEITLRGPVLEFQHDALIAVCGADLSPSIADLEIPAWHAICVESGSILRFGHRRWGCRAYLAVAGGIRVPEVLGSRSTNVRGGFGGLDGRRLAAGDRVPVAAVPERATALIATTAGRRGPMPFALTDVSVSVDAAELYGSGAVRIVTGPQFELLSPRDREAFTTEAFEITPRSDRMGYRLGGPSLTSIGAGDMISTGVVTGTIQLPPGGEPIVLMAERQTTGGYPIVGVVATVDLPRLAQLAPGDSIRFAAISIEEAQLALRNRERELQHLMMGAGRVVSN
jgi:antagonist of KipI